MVIKERAINFLFFDIFKLFVIMSPIHPNLLEEIYYDKFLPLYFKCWVWLKAVVAYNPYLRDRGAPPYRDSSFRKEGNEGGIDFNDDRVYDPYDINFRFPWCQDKQLQKKSMYCVDYLYEETFCSPYFKVVDAGRDFPSVKVEVRQSGTKYSDLKRSLWGIQVELERDAEGQTFRQYYWDSFWKNDRTLLIGPLSLCDHGNNSPFKFTDRGPGGREPLMINVPVYNGQFGGSYYLDYCVNRVSRSQSIMWTIPVKGVHLWSNSHSINERLRPGYEVKIQYQGDRSMPDFTHPNDRVSVWDWEDDRYYGDHTCMSPDIYKYI
jgi:hypothetical protein